MQYTSVCVCICVCVCDPDCWLSSHHCMTFQPPFFAAMAVQPHVVFQPPIILQKSIENSIEKFAVQNQSKIQSEDFEERQILLKKMVFNRRLIPEITLLRVIPTMTFNSSHLTIYLAYLSGIPSGMSSDVLSGIYIF